MSQDVFKKNLIALFSNYGIEPNVDRVRFLTLAIEKSIGFAHDWDKIFLEIATQKKFFPNAAEIVEIAKKHSDAYDVMSNRQKAEILVDRYCMFLTKALNHEDISPYDHKYYKKRFGCDRFAVQNGSVDLNFKRREWVAIAELDFEVIKNTGELSFMNEKPLLSDGQLGKLSGATELLAGLKDQNAQK